MSTELENLKAIRGLPLAHSWQWNDVDGNGVDASGYDWTLQIFAGPRSKEPLVALTDAITATSSGALTLAVAATALSELGVGVYPYRVIGTSGNVYLLLFSGEIGISLTE